jgi:hypothetical protein
MKQEQPGWVLLYTRKVADRETVEEDLEDKNLDE